MSHGKRACGAISRREFLAGCSMAACAGVESAGDRETFTNPIAPRGADPWVVGHEGAYLYCFSRRGAVWISRSKRLEKIGEAQPVRVWKPQAGRPYSSELWAPELHRIEGRWYVYVAADDGANTHHRMYCLERAEADPHGAFELKGKVAARPDRWAIDGTVLKHRDRLYFVWSGWEGMEDVRQDLYIARMKNPWTLEGERVLISRPEHPWECVGRPTVNEGPTALVLGERTHVIYSASGSWTDHYCLGRLTLEGDDPMDAGAWRKHPEPVFAGANGVISPGHASFTTSPDGRERWIVYHAARHAGAGWDRVVCAQPFEVNERSEPVFGEPVAEGESVNAPSGQL